ncbi:NFACT family protein [Nitratidesulfovibrio liaohensis]|uniref:NFACT family protein n=1 Tax=Nitratidesulfovibrio liaohensis TaxID=2604158 RepID=A0ABY9R1P6_9BACT|nr:NFACT family protein [Nitratidesulfovibrio liaohensis]WMW65537.1 NFACT family protein [Nitratidesulfovibrio liaohensis]
MDAHLFRRVCRALVPLLAGCRIEKIHAPAPDIHSLTIFAAGRKQVLVLRHGRRAPLLYLAAHKPPNPARPDAQVMLLRKHLAGRRVVWSGCDWPRRRLALRMAPPAGQPNEAADGQCALVLLDLREGVHLVDALPPDFGVDPVWPQLPPASQSVALQTALRALCDGAATGADPVLTPALRRTLAALVGVGQCAPPSGSTPGGNSDTPFGISGDAPEDGVLDACALLVDLDSGEGDVFLYRQPNESGAGSGEPDELSAWPLPASLRGNRTEEVHESALDAAAILGEAAAFTGLADTARTEAAAPFKAEAGRLRRLLVKLDDEERRLRDLLDQRADGVALQAVLYQYAPDARLPEVTVPDETLSEPAWPEGAGDEASPPAGTVDAGPARTTRTIRLDPLLTVRENMAAMFHRSDRGARGLAILERRRAEVARDLASAEQGAARPPVAGCHRSRPGLRPRLAFLPPAARKAKAVPIPANSRAMPEPAATCSAFAVPTASCCCGGGAPKATRNCCAPPRPLTGGCTRRTAPART